MKKILRMFLFMIGVCPLFSGAQTYPDRPVKMIVPYPAGGPADQIARELANGLSQALGQTFVIEAKGGGSGVIGTGFVAKAAPDGYTLLAGSGAPHIAVPIFSSNPPFDGIKEFVPILMMIDVPNVMVIGPHIQANTVKEFIALAKTKTLTYGSSGTGSSTHLAGEIFQIEANVKMTHVPYKGASPVVNDMLGGHVDVSFLNVSAMLPHLKSGKLRAIGLSAQTRSKALPDVPTLGEQGVPGNTGSWYGLLAPAGTPDSVVRVLYDASVKYFAQPEVRARVEAVGSEIKMLNPQQFLAALNEEKRQLTELNKILKIKMD